MLEICDIKKSFHGNQILSGAGFFIRKGEVVVLHGKNGSGKTTLLRIIAGFEKQDSGTICTTNKNIKILMCHQKPYLFLGTMHSNLLLGLKQHNVINGIVERLQIQHLLKEQAKKLSAGEMQLVAFARAIVASPDILLLDEPTANVDSTHSLLMEEEIERYRESGASIVIVTHSSQFMDKKEYRQLKLDKGKVNPQKHSRTQ